MKELAVVVKQELFNKLGLKIGQLNGCFNEKDEFRLCGSVSADKELPEEYTVSIKVNFCDEGGGILYVLEDYFGVNLDVVNYDSFIKKASFLNVFFDLDKLHHVELYPTVFKRKA